MKSSGALTVWWAVFLDPRWEGLRVLALLPCLMFPSVRPALTVTLLGAWLAVTAAARARGVPLWVRTPLNWPLVLLVATVVMGVAITPFPDLALPKLASIVLGLLAARALLLTASSPVLVWRSTGVYVALGGALIAQGAVVTSWFAKFAVLARATAGMPQVLTHLPGTAPDGVQPNALAGTILFVLPLLLVLLTADRRATVPSGQRTPRTRQAVRRWLWPILIVMTLGLSTLLFVTQSRTAWMAMALTAVILAAIRSRQARRLVIVVALLAVVWGGFASHRIETMVWRAASSTGSLEISWAGRLEVWNRALTATSDFPFTGLGLNAFRRVVHGLYPLALSAPDSDLAHAHNVFLQTALDVGLPGLVAYVSLLLVASLLAWQVYRKAGPTEGILALGLWGNLLAVHLFGLTDAIALGAKVGLLLWLTIGLIAALHRCTVGAGLTTGSHRVG